MAEQTLKAMANKEKCEGIRCAFKTSCGRYLRPEAENQSWAAFYALAGDDCDAFEPLIFVIS
jgi:hypothetical protein